MKTPLRYAIVATLFGWTLACTPAPESSSDTKVAGRRNGSLKGLEALEDILNERIFRPNTEEVRLWSYLESEPNATGLTSLLGAFNETAGFSVQERAVPNAVNTLLWQIASGGLAADLAAKACQASNTNLRADFYAAVRSLCGSRRDIIQEAKAMEALWLALARYDAPELEMKLWVAEEQAEDGIMAMAQGEEGLAQLLQSILMNPYVMLEH